MNLTITQKAFLVVLIISATMVAMTFGLVFSSIGSGLESYAKQRDLTLLKPGVEFIENNYKEFGNWDFIIQNRLRFHHDLIRSFEGMEAESGHGPHQPPPVESFAPGQFRGPPRVSRYIRELMPRVCIFDRERHQIFGPIDQEIGLNEIVLKVDSEPIGYLNLIDVPSDVSDLEDKFVKDLKGNIYTIGGSMLLLSLLAAVLVSRGFIRPLKQIEDGINKICDGDFSTTVELDRKDELGELSSGVNKLAISLNKHNQSRMQWMADTSHELRTPIAILRAQIEAFQDGVQKVTPKTLGVIHSEIMALNRLVDQLYDLSRADLGRLSLRFSAFNPVSLILECVESFENRYEEKNISVETELPENDNTVVQCDADMLKQLFTNLMENSLRYTDAGGKLKISCELKDNRLYIRFDDSEPGVKKDHHEKLFERFFRVDSSRSRLLGGTGLGLSICKNIVESHSGGITAAESPLGGLRVEVWLPADRSKGANKK